jgi:endonuclease-8
MFVGFADDEVWLRVHLGLYGGWRFHGPGLAGLGRRTRAPAEEGLPEPRGAVRLRLLAGKRVADLSGPTACEVLSPEGRRLAMAKLGEDPLRADADPAHAWAQIHASRSAIGLLLMRQDIIAGIGNIYRAELLFRAGIEPHTPGRAITRGEWDAMWADLVELMADGVKTGRIVTTRKGDRSRKGGVRRGDASYVAHRAGKPCRVCGGAVAAEEMAGRTLYWCPVCQPSVSRALVTQAAGVG